MANLSASEIEYEKLAKRLAELVFALLLIAEKACEIDKDSPCNQHKTCSTQYCSPCIAKAVLKERINNE